MSRWPEPEFNSGSEARGLSFLQTHLHYGTVCIWNCELVVSICLVWLRFVEVLVEAVAGVLFGTVRPVHIRSKLWPAFHLAQWGERMCLIILE